MRQEVNPDVNAPIEEEPRERMRIVVDEGQKRERLDVYLTRQVQNATRTKVQEAIEKGLVLVNGHPVKSSYPVLPGDIIEITFLRPPRPEAIPENIPLDIVYEDEYLLVVNKPAGMVTHPAHGHYSGTLVNALLYHCRSLSRANTPLRPGIVHRLDKDTSGLLVVAKDDVVHHHLAKQFSTHTIEREYWAVAWGHFKESKGLIEATLGRSKSNRKKVVVMTEGKHAITEYEVMERFEFLTLLRLKLKTGRTHQIRVHLAHIGHPVFGDPAYGGRNHHWGGLEGKKAQVARALLDVLQRQALHAKTIGFTHPVTQQRLFLSSELAGDIQEVLHRLRQQTA
jgi:23S rRNA pseudouridine1911/1915/1917 synthase